MTWFRIDDAFWSHPKTVALSPQAVALWIRAGSYACAHLTDGFVAHHSCVTVLQGTPKAIAELTRVTPGHAHALWAKVDGGYQFHDWGVYQEKSQVILQRRKETAERTAAWRARRNAGGDASQKVSPTEHVRDEYALPGPGPVPIDQDTHTHRQSHTARANADDSSTPGDKYQKALAATAGRLSKEAGEEVSILQAGVVVDHILGKARGDVKDPARYVARSISGNVNGWVNFIHTDKLPTD